MGTSEFLEGLRDNLLSLCRTVVVGDGLSTGLLDLGNDLVGVLPREIVDENGRSSRSKEERVWRDVGCVNVSRLKVEERGRGEEWVSCAREGGETHRLVRVLLQRQ